MILMFLRSLTAPPGKALNLKPAAVEALARLGITTIAGFLLHYPRGWIDRRNHVPISGFRNANVCTTVTVIARDWVFSGGRKTLKIYVEDDSGRAALMCYNRPWLGKQLIQGNRYRLWGSFDYKYREIQSGAFDFEPAESNEDISAGFNSGFNRILPVYPLTASLKQEKLRDYISCVLDKYCSSLHDELPAHIIERYNLLHKKDAIRAIHYPDSDEELELAKKSIIYEELFYLEVMVGKRVIEKRVSCPAGQNNILPENSQKIVTFSPLQKRLLERLPFSLTEGQVNAVMEINRDLGVTGNTARSGEAFAKAASAASSPMAPPMARLLQGDVGCGKTLVSFLAALPAVEEGGQAAIMAPTELLARQHAENAARLLEPLGLNIAFLTGNVKAAGRRDLLKNLADGEINIVIGTHALFSNDVIYKNLKFVVIDEQHRFGVTQRSLIMTKGENPALLMMSATPIPRTLALTVFGDMDVSVIKDMPSGRKPVKTHLAKESNEKRVYDYVRAELELGRQAYFVYPLIDGGDEIKDAVSMADRLSKEIFPEYRTALIHSKLPEDEKRRVMEDFRAGEIKILAATSVVEVGVDVPNATCMVIEHAERFGLSALHQLRGRVGRGQEQSYCFLVYSDELTDDGKTRLRVMLENTDGFIIAEEDLKLRGPGLIAGTEQSGYLVLGLANPIRDIEQLERAREDAFAILESDPGLLLADNSVIARVLNEVPPFSEVNL